MAESSRPIGVDSKNGKLYMYGKDGTVTELPVYGVDITEKDSDLPYTPTPGLPKTVEHFPYTEIIMALMNMLGERVVRLDAVDLHLASTLAQHNRLQLIQIQDPRQLRIEVVPK